MCTFAGQKFECLFIKMKKMKRPYSQPEILREVSFCADSLMVKASIVDSISQIESTGQTVIEQDFTETGFNHTWGD